MAEKKKAKPEKKLEKAKKLVGTVPSRGRIFEGTVTKVFPHRVVIESERTIYVQKYERYYKKKTKLHARVPEGVEINLGDLVKIQETRPLSKIVHFIVIEIVKKVTKEEKEE